MFGKDNPAKAARSTLKKFWKADAIPVDPVAVAVRLGIPVLAEPGIEVAGLYTPDAGNKGEDDPLISHDALASHEKRRFAIAHMIGHHVLGHGPMHGDLVPPDFSASPADGREADANRFALDLLMPETAVRAMVEVRKERGLRNLAGMFGVSTAAMGLRLRELGYDVVAGA